MKVTGIVAEYNPFHNGHRYQIEQIRNSCEDSFIIAVMSGSFVQRGEPSIYDKYTRTKAALNGGADLILELPSAFATSSAEDFAAAAVALLDQLGIVDEICFGSECGDIAVLDELASVLAEEPKDYQDLLRAYVSSGNTFPRARNLALLDWLKGMEIPDRPDNSQGNSDKYQNWNTVLSSPNNILGIEYIKALKKRGSSIKPVTITRFGQGYHDTALIGGHASASGIRTGLAGTSRTGLPDCLTGHSRTGFPAGLAAQVPAEAAKLYQTAVPIFPDDCSLLLNERLMQLESRQMPFSEFADISGELAARISRQLLDFAPYSDRIEKLKTRQYTYTRISRGLLHILLDITKEDISCYRSLDYTPYARILGFRKEASLLLARIKKTSAIPLINKTADAKNHLAGAALAMLHKDFYCTHTYQALIYEKSGILPRNEYTQSIMIL